MDSLHDNFSVGDDVMCPQNYGKAVRGTVRKVTPASVTVDKATGSSETYRRRKYGNAFECRKRTEADQREEDYEAALAAWKLAQPVCKVMSIRLGGWRLDRARVSLDASIETAGDVEAIDADMAAIREWLRKRPEEPQ